MFKKFASFGLAIMMLVSMAATVFAADAQVERVRDDQVTTLASARSSKTGSFYGKYGDGSKTISFKVSKGETKANVKIQVPSSQDYSIELIADLKSLGKFSASGNSSWNITNIDSTTSCKVIIWAKGSGASYSYTITGS